MRKRPQNKPILRAQPITLQITVPEGEFNELLQYAKWGGLG
jgi:hypothetical protein